ncbi:MAG TPA: FAD-linked oxidase C-terminal domain-containing protein [Candidatus Saccharimonadales bacterium]|nr:FAD-linked oxidase C-terminal domain-containing protein [Candidatus Saccharimonadales bacterium]
MSQSDDRGVDSSRAAAVAELKAQLGERVRTDAAALEQHSRDESHHYPALPDAVVSCDSVDVIASTLKTCNRAGLPVIPFGAGTGLEGGVIPIHGGVSLDLSGMDRILRVGVDDLDVTVEAGVTLSQLNQRLGGDGLFFPVDPGSNPTLGGMVATGASGTNAVRYGTMKESTLGLTVVLADGDVVQTGGRARKSAAGYDLTRLFVGSEGTLAVIATATLRIWGLPEHVAAAVCSFVDLHQAVSAVIQMIQFGIPLARIELLDDVMVEAINRFSQLEYQVGPTLLLEFHGGPASVAEQIAESTNIVQSHSGQLEWTSSPGERTRLWQARHHALYAAKALRPGASTWATDVCVPISALAECIDQTKADILGSGVVAPIVGHVGDGNFHLSFVLFPDDSQEMAAATGVHERLVARALALDGTCTGEHGIGLGKMSFLEAEHGSGVALMRRLKGTLDPVGIMNPGKVLVDQWAEVER